MNSCKVSKFNKQNINLYVKTKCTYINLLQYYCVNIDTVKGHTLIFKIGLYRNCAYNIVFLGLIWKNIRVVF